MRTLNYHGTDLTAGQRRRLAFEQQARTSFPDSILIAQVDEALAKLRSQKEQGVKPPRYWFVERQEKGTACIAEWMGY